MLLQTLAAWPAPGAPQWMILPAIGSKIGCALLQRVVVAADHEGKGAGHRTLDPAGDRRVELGQTVRAC